MKKKKVVLFEKFKNWYVRNKDEIISVKERVKQFLLRCWDFFVAVLVLSAFVSTVAMPFLEGFVNKWLALGIWVPSALLVIIYDIRLTIAVKKEVHISKDIKTFENLCDVFSAYGSGIIMPVFSSAFIINYFDTPFNWWWAGALILLVVAILGPVKLFQIIKVFTDLDKQKLKQLKKNVSKTAVFYLIVDAFYISAFNKWSAAFFILGTLALAIQLTSVATAFLRKKFRYTGFLLHDFIAAIGLTVYLIFEIPNAELQQIVLAIISSLYGGFIALVGVAWTIEEGQHRDIETKRLEKMPYLRVEFQDWMTKDERNGDTFAEKYLDIEKTDIKNNVAGGYSIVIKNIGLGLATDMMYDWKGEYDPSKEGLPSFLLRCDEFHKANIMFFASREGVDDHCRTVTRDLEFAFDDILGNHYIQSMKIVFNVHAGYVSIVSTEMHAPEYVQA